MSWQWTKSHYAMLFCMSAIAVFASFALPTSRMGATPLVSSTGCNFRNGEEALAADISEMFLQVELHEADRKYHRFVWSQSPSDPVVFFEFCRVVFCILPIWQVVCSKPWTRSSRMKTMRTPSKRSMTTSMWTICFHPSHQMKLHREPKASCSKSQSEERSMQVGEQLSVRALSPFQNQTEPIAVPSSSQIAIRPQLSSTRRSE